MNLLFLKQYNNYANNIVKHSESTIKNIILEYDHRLYTNINFNPNDGIKTNQIINWDMDWLPDYMFTYNDNGSIDSSWFVINNVRTRNGQYNFTLKRDTINDYYDQVKESTCIIKKAKLSADSDLIYNSEGTQVNQIKQQEYLLKDKSKIPWIVGYFVQDDQAYPNTETSTSFITEITKKDQTAVSWANLDFTPVANETVVVADKRSNASTCLVIPFYMGINKYNAFYYPYNKTLQIRYVPRSQNLVYYMFSADGVNGEQLKTAIYNTCVSMNDAIIKRIVEVYIGSYSATDVDMSQYSSDFLSFSGTQYYTLNISKNESWSTIKEASVNAFEELTNNFKNLLNSKITGLKWTNKKLSFYAGNCVAYNVTATPTHQGLYSTHIPATRDHLNSFPYDMFCMPYGRLEGMCEYEGKYFNKDVPKGTGTFVTNKDVSMAMAREIANKLKGTTSALYDLQVVPYCPVPELLDDNGSMYYLTNKANTEYTYVPILEQDGDSYIIRSIMFWCQKSQFDFTIKTAYKYDYNNFVEIMDVNLSLTWNDGLGEYYGTVTIPDNMTIKYIGVNKTYTQIDNKLHFISKTEGTVTGTIQYYDPAIAKKVLCETEMCRLVSPNYNGQFEYNPIKNGELDYFQINVRYKPYTPYIHVAPDFKNLYGARPFNDARGLICNGDFSIDTTSDQFAQYELANKNYQNSFDRQIQNLDVTNTYARLNDIFTASAGVLQGAAQGSYLGGSLGAGLGAAGSAIAGTADVVTKELLRKENRQYTIDQYNYSLANVKALPNSLSNVSSINQNNKFFPILETYTCTDEEQLAIKKKVEKTGMTVNVIGTLGDYITGNKDYVKATIIKIEGVDSYNIVQDINNELEQGWYF